MKRLLVIPVLVLLLAGCQSSTTISYVFIGDAAFRNAKVPPIPTGLTAVPNPTPNPTPGNQGQQELGGQSATNGTNIIIGVNSTTSKPVDVSAANGNNVAVGKESTLTTATRVGGAAVGGAIGGPGGAAAGTLLPEAAITVKTVATEAFNALKP